MMDELLISENHLIKLLDAAGLWMSKKYGADFGQQKMAGSLSMIIVPVFCGLLIDAISDKLGNIDPCSSQIGEHF